MYNKNMKPVAVQKIEISAKTIIFAVLFIIFLRVIYLSRELIYALFLAFIFMSALKPTINFLSERKIPHTIAVLIVYFTTIFLIVAALSAVLPPLIQESIFLLKSFPFLIQKIFPNLFYYLDIQSATRFLPDLTQNFFKLLGNVFSNLIFVITINFFTFYFLLEEQLVKKFLDKFIEARQSERIVQIIERVEERMGAWVRGEAVLMTIIGLSTYIGLSILNVNYALPLAIIAGLLEVVPNIGPIISAIPAFFVGLSFSPTLGFYVVILYTIIQQLENNLIVPLVMQRAVGLNPIFTLIALTVGLKLGGTWGILLSVPIALCIETILTEFVKVRNSKII